MSEIISLSEKSFLITFFSEYKYNWYTQFKAKSLEESIRSISRKVNNISANISNSEIQININNRKIENVNCSCMRNNCYHFEQLLAYLILVNKEIKKPISSLQIKEFDGKQFVKWYPVAYLKKIITNNSYYIYYEGRVVSQKKIEFRTEYNMPKIDIYFQEGKIGLYCEKCDNDRFEICSHVKDLISNKSINHVLINFIDANFTLEDLKNSQDAFKDLPLDVFLSLTKIILDGDGFYVELIDRSLFLESSEIKEIHEALNYNSNKNKNFFSGLKSERTLRNGICWSEDSIINFIEGTTNSKSNALNTKLKIVNYPAHLDDNQKSFFVDFYHKIHSNNHANIIQIAHYNSDILSTIPHYYTLHDIQYDFKKKNLFQFSFSKDILTLKGFKKTEKNIYKAGFKIYINNAVVYKKDIQFRNDFFIIVNDQAYFFPSPNINLFFAICDNNFSVTTLSHLKDNIELIESLLSKLGVIFENETKKALPINKKSSSFNDLEDEVKSLQDEWTKADSKELAIISDSEDNFEYKKQIYITEEEEYLLFEPVLFADDISYSLLQNYEVPSEYQSDANSIIDFMFEIQPKFKNNIVNNRFYLHISDVLKDQWFIDFYSRSKDSQIEIFGQELLSSLRFNMNRARIKISIQKQVTWIEPEVEIFFGDLSVRQEAWIDAVKRNEKYVKLSDGTHGVLTDDWFKQLRKLATVSEVVNKKLQIHKLKFNVIEDIFPLIDDDQLKLEILEKKQALHNYTENSVYTLPKKLKAKLRPYQIKGYQWLRFLDEYNFGGILADDMGLGKTLEVIAFLQDQANIKAKPNLVVVPRSLTFNWQNELDKFAPSIKYLEYHGNNRANLLKDFTKYDVIITTYDIATRDIDELIKIVFNYVILDESQAIKNTDSKRYKAMRLLRAKNKLTITGTPIENSILDLFAQFSFVNPGFFGSEKSFLSKFSSISDGQDRNEMARELQRMIHPFILRRTKDQVAPELPEKVETILYCDMPPAQRKMYDTLREQIRKDLYENNTNIKFRLLEGLTKLRLLCDAPELIDSKLSEQNKVSAKIETLLEQIEEIGDNKALIFSQFVGMLSIIRRELDARGIVYAYIDGSTTKRQEQVNFFMNNDSCKLFLISLKAGNTGLNLTKAQYVFLVDPWWNPAVEAQAIDRTHRIGQEKNVFAYKLICRDTIEEKILKLQQQKSKLASDIIQVDENIFKSMKKEDLLTLFDD